jgi:hypothetical protein
VAKAIDHGPGNGPRQPALDEFVELIHRLAMRSENILWDHPHVQQRMAQRDKSMREVIEVLRNGVGTRGPVQDKFGDYRVRLSGVVAGRRTQVVVAVHATMLTVVTVI